jgi:hypothetical protein
VAQKPPPPLAQSFLICREIFQDRQSGEYMLLSPFNSMTLPGFPAMFRLSLFIQLTGCHGTYQIKLRMQDQGDDVCAECEGPQALVQNDPLHFMQICWRDIVVQFPHPGRYELILLANSEEVARHDLTVGLKANL